MEEVYTKQLEAILFSVNQYSDDIFNSWVSKVQMWVTENHSSAPQSLQNLFEFNPCINGFFSVDTVNLLPSIRFFSPSQSIRSDRVYQAIVNKKTGIEQLIDYKKNGFQKIETISFENESDTLKCLLFILGDDEKNFRLAGFLIDPVTFVQDVIGPRLQVIAKDQFVISVFKSKINTPVYSTLRADSLTMRTEASTKSLWLFPDYTMGIRPNGTSLKSVIDQRTNTNLLLLIVLDLVLITSVVMVFRNVKREVQLAQNKSDFVSNVSHEIRTPLALISMFAETLELGRVQSDEKKQAYYEIIHKEALRLSGIVNKILNFSQTEANKKILNIIALEAGAQIKEILKTYDFHLKNKGFEYQFNQSENLRIKADQEAFTEVLINLIDNAVKYSQEKKNIQITTARENGFGLILVKDQGVGISKMDQKYIFDKFHRVSSGNLAKAAGTGLGLSLVKQLMEMQKGKVSVFSEPGKGSQFTLYFPLDLNYP